MRLDVKRVGFALAVALLGPGAYAGQWVASTKVDQMTGVKRVQAMLRSAPTQSLGGVSAALGVVAESDSDGAPPTVWLTVPKRQLYCRPRCEVKIRIDQEPFRGVMATPSADGSYDTVFLGGEWLLIDELKRAKRLRIEVPVYQSGAHILEFSAAGFVEPKAD